MRKYTKGKYIWGGFFIWHFVTSSLGLELFRFPGNGIRELPLIFKYSILDPSLIAKQWLCSACVRWEEVTLKNKVYSLQQTWKIHYYLNTCRITKLCCEISSIIQHSLSIIHHPSSIIHHQSSSIWYIWLWLIMVIRSQVPVDEWSREGVRWSIFLLFNLLTFKLFYSFLY